MATTTETIKFFTPVSFEKPYWEPSFCQKILETADRVTTFSDSKAVVINRVSENNYAVQIESYDPSVFETVSKIVCIVLVLPYAICFITKVFLRCKYSFTIYTPVTDPHKLTNEERQELSTPLPTGFWDRFEYLNARLDQGLLTKNEQEELTTTTARLQRRQELGNHLLLRHLSTASQ